MNGNVAVYAFDSEQGSEANCGVPESLMDVPAWLQSVIEKVPPEYRGAAVFDIDTAGYDSQMAAVTVWYERPETDEEVKQREARTAQQNGWREQQEREEYERLAAKYGPLKP